MANHSELARASLDLAKRMFKDFTGVTLEHARELIQLEDQLNAISSDIPKAEDEHVNITNTEKKEVVKPEIKKAQTPPVKQDDDDLPF